MGTIVTIVKIGSAGLICGKALKVFGKKDYGDIINFVTFLSCGVLLLGLIFGWLDNLAYFIANNPVTEFIVGIKDSLEWIKNTF